MEDGNDQSRGQGSPDHRSGTRTRPLACTGADIIAIDICADMGTIDYPNASTSDLQETVKLVEALDRRIFAVEADVRDAEAVKDAVDRALRSSDAWTSCCPMRESSGSAKIPRTTPSSGRTSCPRT
jgi:hypothetical protein